MSANEQRCDCGRLLFKRTKRGFEFKCHRCKRIHLIPFDWDGKSDFQNLCPIVDELQVTPEARDHESNAQQRKDVNA